MTEEKEQTIFRVKKSKENPYVMMDKRPIENDSLSWKAKGLLSYLLSRPDDWIIHISHLVKQSKDGKAAVVSAMNELIEAGYIVKIGQTKDEQARFTRNEYHVHEIPCPIFRDGKPVAENHTLNKIDSNKKDLSNSLNKGKKKKSKLPKGALAFKVSAGEVPTEQDVKDYEEATAGIRWKYRDQFHETLLPLADLCAAYFGDPPKKDLMFWMGEIGDWQQFGCSKEDFESATKAAEKWTQPPASPVSLTKTIRSFRMKRKRGETLTSETNTASQDTLSFLKSRIAASEAA